MMKITRSFDFENAITFPSLDDVKAGPGRFETKARNGKQASVACHDSFTRILLGTRWIQAQHRDGPRGAITSFAGSYQDNYGQQGRCYS